MKNIIFLYASLLLTFTLGSCSDFLEQEPGSQISIEEQLATRQGVLMALNGTYSELEETMRSERFAVYADLQGGNLKFTPTPSGSNKGRISIPVNLEQVYNFQDLEESSDFESFYDGCYRIINGANLVLENAGNLQDASESEIAQIKAEAYALRGFAHYLLTLVYAQNYSYDNGNQPGIIYIRESLQEELSYPSRESVATTYDLILADMETAMQLFTSASALAGPDYSYFNALNVKAVMARIALSANQWDRAISLAEEVLQQAGPITPLEDYVSQWNDPEQPLSETLLELTPPRDSGGSLGGSLASHFGYASTSTFGDYVATADLLDLYAPEDIRGTLFLEKTISTLGTNGLEDQPYFFTSKFQGEPGYPVIRLSEMHLITAEAALRTGASETALEHLNVIRQRAGLPSLTNTQDLEEQVLLERRREFCFEGHLLFDLTRNHRGVSRTDGCISQNCQMNYPSLQFVLPIPQKNINLNQNLTQNEGY